MFSQWRRSGAFPLTKETLSGEMQSSDVHTAPAGPGEPGSRGRVGPPRLKGLQIFQKGMLFRIW